MKMTKYYLTRLASVFLLCTILLILTSPILGQQKQPDFSSPAYQKAIENITELSNGEITAENIQTFIGTRSISVRSIDANESITVSPVIDFVQWDGNTNAEFTITAYPTDSVLTIVESDIVINEGWASFVSVNNTNAYTATLIIDVQENDSEEARAVELTINALVGNVSVTPVSAYIIQDGKPFLYVVPNFRSISSSASDQESFDVVHNLAGWTYDENTIPSDNWIYDPNVNNDNTFTFSVTANDDTTSRTATIKIRQQGNEDVYDSLTIVQGGSGKYLSVFPEFQSRPETGGTTEPFNIVGINIAGWEVDGTTVPGDWISANPDHLNNTITFTLQSNETNSSARSATIKVHETDNEDLFTELVIIQAGTAPYLKVIPNFQAVSYLGGPTATFDIIGFNINGWNVSDINDPDGMISGNQPNFTNNTISFTTTMNNSDTYREAIITIENTAGNKSDEITLVQGTESQPFIMITPDVQSVDFSGGTTGQFDIINFNLNGWEVVDETIQDEWISINDENNAGNFVTFNVEPNNTDQLRSDTISIQETGNSQVIDSLIIFQGPDVMPFIFATPGFQSVTYENGTSDLVDIINFNIENWEWEWFEMNNPGWITPIPQSGDKIKFDFDENTTGAFREAQIKVFATDTVGIYDTITIYQDANPLPELLTAPREQFVGHLGNDSVGFHVTAINTDGDWLIDSTTLKPWVSDTSYFYHDSVFALVVEPNNTLHTRIDSITIYAAYNPAMDTVYDTIVVYQYSGLDSYLLTEPREQAVSWTKETIQYKITAVNIDGDWNVEENTLEDWVSYQKDPDYDSILYITVDTNYSIQTRRDSITIYATANGDIITDTISVYQYAGPDPYLLAAPREQAVSHLGNDAVNFKITTVNTEDNWIVDSSSVKNWINFSYNYSDSLFILEVDTNQTLQTRMDTIVLSAYFAPLDSTIFDTIAIYQYSTLDTFLLAAPREQSVLYTDTTIHFKITPVNLPGGWEIDQMSVQDDWITASKINDTLKLVILENNLLETRIDTIKIFATNHPDIFDTVVVYQDSRPDPYLIAAPREQRVGHMGNDSVEFKITLANIAGWNFVDESKIPNWIEGYVNDSILRFDVLQNDSLATRVSTIFIQATDLPEVIDSVTIYQYSALDTFLLAAPREQTALYSGDSLVFDITTANVPGGWEIIGDTTSWIINRTNINDQDSLLSLTITENPFFETRQATVYYQAKDYPNVFDSVTVYQYAQPTPYILAHPREQTAKHTADTLQYVILPVNLDDSGWTADTTTFKEWVSFDEEASNDTLLVLNIEPNESLVTRMDTVTIYAIDPAGDDDVTDEVIIYQYSGLDKYLLAEPREWEVPAEGENDIIFTITPVNMGEAGWQILDESVAEWVTAEISGDTLLLDVSRNLSTETRSNTITIYSPVYEDVKDSITVYQFAGGSNFILAHPRERKISHFGELDVEFQVTSVNNEDWTFDQLTINDWMIDSPQKDDNTFRFNVVRNDSLTSQINKIILHATDSLEIKDTVVVYQYSSLDAYILASPREQFVSIYRDTAVFDILAVNLDTDWDVDISSIGNWVHSYWKDPLGTKLLIDVEVNTTAVDRKDYIRLKGQYHDSTIVDSILIIQEAPSLIFNPYALDMIPALKEGTADTILPVYTFSNFAEYVVFKQDPTEDWYSISSKYNTPAADTISLNYNDTIFIKVDLNPSSFSHRQAFLRFRSPDLRIDKSYYIRQNEAEGTTFKISGTITLEGNPDSTLQGIDVIVGEYDTITDNNGVYIKRIPSGWRGSITPVVDKYFFYPESVPIDRPVDEDITVNFEAYVIKPKLVFTLDSTSICIGETLKSNEINRYPNALITGTYQLDIKYKWSSIPNDTALARQDTLLNPEFKPIVNTIYQLTITNQGLSDTARFKLIVRPRPQVTEFYGLTPDTVCRNQAGAIYLADIDSTSAEHFHWRLHDGGGTFDTLTNSNIAIVNWGNVPGSYPLTLKSHNDYGCSATDSVVRVITVSEQEAPPQATVQWKNPDNMLYCTDPLVDHCIWGWFEMNGTELVEQPFVIPNKNDWYVRLPDNHEFNPLKNHYFVITFYDSLSCGSLTFYNPPLDVPEHNDGNISVFPNPTDGLINIRFNNLSESQSGTLQLYNIAGQIIYQEDLNLVRNNSIVTVRDVSYPEAGIYILRIRTEDYFFNTKIVVR